MGRTAPGRNSICSRTGRKETKCELYFNDQFILGFGHDKSVVNRAGVVILCVTACMQQEQLDRVVSGAESGAFRTDGIKQVRNTEGEK